MRTTMWAGGAELAGQGAVQVVANPATEEPLAEVPSASPGQVDRAVQAARAALGGWRRTPAGDRGELLHGVAAWLRAHTEELGRLMTLEGGKPLVENTDEVGWTANAFSYYAELGRHERGRVIPSIEEGQLSLVLKEPVGVVATIVPWNYPLLLLAWKVAPALAAGNTVVVKPSPYTPLATLRLAEAFAGFPDGVVNLVTGGAEVGEALVVHGGTDLVAFTGSVATGQRIGALCAEQVKRTHLELGGKDAFIVCDDVDLEVAAPGAAWAAYLNAGQVCTSAERFYVLEPVFDEFVDRLVSVTKELRLGDPLDPATDVGPMVAEAQRARVEGQLEGAVRAGGQAPGRRGPRRPRTRLVPGPDGGGGRRRHHGPAHHRDLRAGRPRAAGRLPGRGHRPGQRPPLRPGGQRLHPANGLHPALHGGAGGGHGLVQRPPHRQRRRAVRRHEDVRQQPRAGPRGPGGVPGDQARPPRRARQPEAVVVSVRSRELA
jgi:acyl-CoA reductase-like NAD-dependent aldehyde dehydrogenase